MGETDFVAAANSLASQALRESCDAAVRSRRGMQPVNVLGIRPFPIDEAKTLRTSSDIRP